MLTITNLSSLPKKVKIFLAFFLLALSFGYFSGVLYLNTSSQTTISGIESNYLGNENDEDAETMMFKKSEREILGIIHTHAITISLVFLVLGTLVYMADIPEGIKKFLMIEPFLSIVITFSGIWVMWKGWVWFKYVLMVSGIFLHGSFFVIILILYWQLLKKPTP